MCTKMTCLQTFKKIDCDIGFIVENTESLFLKALGRRGG